MKKIYYIAFWGMSMSDPDYTTINPLLRTGHVGIAFEGDPKIIYGFHPPKSVIDSMGGIDALMSFLGEGGIVDGTVQQDYDLFEEAYRFAKTLPPDVKRSTVVYQLAHDVSDVEFEAIRLKFAGWYNTKEVFPYAFSAKEQNDSLPLPERDNCATFPRRADLQVFDRLKRGRMSEYIAALKEQVGVERWIPEGN